MSCQFRMETNKNVKLEDIDYIVVVVGGVRVCVT